MSKNSDLLQEAIAEANAVREIALQNAEEVLKENFHDRLQSMVEKSLQVEEEDEEDEFEEGSYFEKKGEEAPEEEAPEEEEEAEESFSAYEAGGEGEEEAPEEEEEMTDEDIELEAIIRELEAQIAEAEKEEDGEEAPEEEEELEEAEEIEEASDSSKIGSGDNKMPDSKASSSAASEDPEKLQKGNQNKNAESPKKMDEGEEVKLDELLEEFFGESKDEEDDDKEDKKVEEVNVELDEAYSTIEELRNTINEVNLLNAKLLYSNKIFRSYSLNENQKMKVIESFDRAGSIRETKLIFATIVESYNTPAKRKTVNEGFASKSTGSAPKPSQGKIINENKVVKRFQYLANIKN